jgi:protein-L-isoaspartate(D-aspartate) O-methyltransferase
MFAMRTLEECRRLYAEEIRAAAGLRSAALVGAFARVPREGFLGPGPWKIVSAGQLGSSNTDPGRPTYRTTNDARDVYQDVLVALDASRGLNNGLPSSLAHWIGALDLKPGDRIFHLGCGAGYYTAIMAEIVGAKGNVIASEVDADLAVRAKENLAGYPNVAVHGGDGAAFDPGGCDAMLINAGVTHPAPRWLRRLRSGGRMVLPLTVAIGQAHGKGVMARIIREGKGFSASVLTPVGIYSCSSLRDPQWERLLSEALANGALDRLRSVRLGPHPKGETCLLHGRGVCLSAAGPGASPRS